MQGVFYRAYITPESRIGQGEEVGDAGRTPTEEEKKAAKLAKVRENFRDAAELSAADYADGTQSHPGLEALKAAVGAAAAKGGKKSTSSTSTEPLTQSSSTTGKTSTSSTSVSIHSAVKKKKLGDRKTNYRSHGQPVYYNEKYYMTPDIDGHNGGTWGMANSVKELGSKKRAWKHMIKI